MGWNEVGNLKGPGMRYRGQYSASTTYSVGDVVSYSYGSWVAKAQTVGVDPSTSGLGADVWGQVAARGAQGGQGATGAKGATGAQGPQGPQGPEGAAAPKYYGVLRWSGPWYNPPANTFTRLKTYSDGRLKLHQDRGGVAYATGEDSFLYIPVDGMWQISATQTWGNTAVTKGCGLGQSKTSGVEKMELWGDFNGYNHGSVSRATFLTKGTYLYPWTWNGLNSGMSPVDRGLVSEYSAVLLQPF